MYLNLFSVIERSSFKIHNLFSQNPESFDIDSVCVISSDMDIPNLHSLCIADRSQFARLRDLPIHLISNTPIDTDEDISNNLSYSYVEKDIDPKDLASDLKDVMLRYSKCVSDVQSAIIRSANLPDILGLAGRLLRNPVALFDNNQNLLCYSADEETARQFSLWDFVLTHGYSSDLSDEDALTKLFHEKKTPFYFRSSDDNQDTLRLITPIYYDSFLFGCLGSVNSYESFTHCDYADSCVVQNLIEQTIHVSSEFNLNVEVVPWYIVQALRGKDINDNVADYNLRKSGHSIRDKYRLLTFQHLSNDSGADADTVRKAASSIALLFSDALTYCYNQQIVVIDYNTCRIENRDFFSRLSKALRRNSLCCGASMVFFNFSSLHQAFMQSLIAARYSSDNACAFFNDYLSNYIFDSLRKENEHDGIIFPGLDNIIKKDPVYGKELIRCLEIYILNGCNTTATAKELFLHRNTVIYRLEQIQELFSVDFDHLTKEERLLLIFSCEMLLADHVN